MSGGTASFGITGVDWQERINWDRLRNYRIERARAMMKEAGLGAMLLMYDENVRYVTSTLTPGWNRLKPGPYSPSGTESVLQFTTADFEPGRKPAPQQRKKKTMTHTWRRGKPRG